MVSRNVLKIRFKLFLKNSIKFHILKTFLFLFNAFPNSDNTHYLMGLPDPRIQVISVKNTRSALLTDPSWNVVESSNDFLVALHCATGMRCKFSFFDGFYHETSFFIKYLLELQPEARKLVYFAKIWFKHENIKMNGYLITVLVIFFLQQKKLLPSVQAIQKNCFPYWVRSEF